MIKFYQKKKYTKILFNDTKFLECNKKKFLRTNTFIKLFSVKCCLFFTIFITFHHNKKCINLVKR